MHKHGGDIYRNQGVVDYSANINFRGMPESVRQAAKDAIDASVCYPDPQCEELKAAIEAEGGKVAGSVSGNTDYLITNNPESGSSKNRAARELGVSIITEEDILGMIGQSEA